MPFPNRILIVRHGEKPGDPNDSHDGSDLSSRGYQRAGALAPYIADQYGPPDFLFATQASKHSNRPVETLVPLATRLGLDIHSSYGDGEYGKLADHLLSDPKYAGKTILICWHHGEIPALTAALGAQPPKNPPKDKWPPEVFDRVWLIAYPTEDDPSAGALPVANLPQRLLYGDSAE